jgi:hypothetical protein
MAIEPVNKHLDYKCKMINISFSRSIQNISYSAAMFNIVLHVRPAFKQFCQLFVVYLITPLRISSKLGHGTTMLKQSRSIGWTRLLQHGCSISQSGQDPWWCDKIDYKELAKLLNAVLTWSTILNIAAL